MAPFIQATNFIFLVEGGYSNDPDDAETKYGISKRFFPNIDIPNLTLDAARDIYKQGYWEPMNCDQLPYSVAIAIFDCAVNQGRGISTRLLQRTARVKADGIFGPVTMKAVRAMDPKEFLVDFLARRAKRYAGTDGVERYGRGWYRRLFEVHQEALYPSNN